jgi:hypothetical protein
MGWPGGDETSGFLFKDRKMSPAGYIADGGYTPTLGTGRFRQDERFGEAAYFSLKRKRILISIYRGYDWNQSWLHKNVFSTQKRAFCDGTPMRAVLKTAAAGYYPCWTAILFRHVSFEVVVHPSRKNVRSSLSLFELR